MEKERLKTQKEKELVKSSVAKKPVAGFTGESIVSYLSETMGVSRTMVAALLDVTERTLVNWSAQTFEELSASGGNKSKRLVALYEFINKADRLKVPKSAMVSLLQDPIQPEDEHSNTPMYFIIEEPESSCLRSTGDLIIQNFLKT